MTKSNNIKRIIKRMALGWIRMLGFQTFGFLLAAFVLTLVGIPFTLSTAIYNLLFVMVLGTVGWLIGWAFAYSTLGRS